MAKVEIIYGRKVEGRMRIRQSFECLPLWDKYEGVEVLFALEEDYENPDHKYKFRRAMVMVSHPQKMVWEQKHGALATKQDRSIEVAWLMAKGPGKLSFVPYYYSERKWKEYVPSLAEMAEIKVFGHGVRRLGEVTSRTILGDGKTEDYVGTWDSFFMRILDNRSL